MAAENIFQAYAQAPKSVIEYGADLDRRDLLQQQLQGQIRQNSIADLTAAQTRDTLAQSAAGRNAIQSVYQNLSPTATIDELTSKLRATGNQDAIAHADQKEKAAADIGAQKALAFKNTQEGGHFNAQSTNLAQDNTIKAHSEHLKALQGVSSPQEMDQWLRSGVGAGALDLTKAANVSATLQQDPSQFAALRQKMLDTGVDIQERFKQGEETARSAASNATSVANNTASNRTHLQTTGMTQAGENARAAAGRNNTLMIAGLNPDGSMKEDGGLLNAASVANAAARYNMDGTLPPNLGRGSQGPRQTAMILNEAAGQAASRGDTPEAQRVAQLANKASAVALNKLSGQEAVVGAAEKNFTANADMVSGLAKKVDNTGVPILNKWINAGKRSVAGNPDISALDTNIKATVNEYAKIVGGGTGGGATAQGEVTKIEGLLSAAQSPQQIEAVLNVMRQETANRMKSFKDQKAELTGSMIPVKTASPKASGATPSAGSQQPREVHFGELK